MRYVMYRFFSIGDYEKEEKWLNEQSARGLQFVDTNGIRYVFEDGSRGAYLYRLELLTHRPNHPESAAYLRFLEETGIEHVGSFRSWVYLRKKASDGAFELYSDLDSKIAHCRRILRIGTGISFALLAGIAAELIVAGMQYYGQPHIAGAGKMFHTPYFAAVVYLFALIGFVQLVVGPIRKMRKKLHAEKQISE